MTPNVLIATPTHRGEVAIEYMQSVMALISALPQAKMSGAFVCRLGAAIDLQRNWLASFFWAHEQFTHLLFVDDDMIFKPSAALKLIGSGYDVCGCVYPRRHFDMERYHLARLDIDKAETARNASQRYVGSVRSEQECADKDNHDVRRPGFISVNWIGCGIMLITREAIGTMLKSSIQPSNSFYHSSFSDIPGRKEIIRFFDHIDDPNGIRLTEDVSFCHRWSVLCGRTLWACVDEEIGHVGRHIFTGRASDHKDYNPMLLSFG